MNYDPRSFCAGYRSLYLTVTMFHIIILCYVQRNKLDFHLFITHFDRLIVINVSFRSYK